MKKTHN